MTRPTIYYIALGTNKGTKLKNLQLAVNEIYKRIGTITLISKIYRSTAIGFKGDDFLNACITLQSTLKPQNVLDIVLKIETDLGRTRSLKQGYQSRIIDLDIIFVEDIIINTKTLQVPHPELQNRKFVLLPLHDIASQKKHPQLRKTIANLLQSCKDTSKVHPITDSLQNPNKLYKLLNLNYIAIEGNIGAGKTSLAHKIADDLNAKLILERFADNPFLPKFYQDTGRYAFILEMSFLADRYQQISEELSQLNLSNHLVVSDYYVFKSLIFSKITLAKDEFSLYRKLFNLMYKDITKPKLYIFLYQNTDRLLANIKKRGRNYELNIDETYLEKINTGYITFLKTQKNIDIRIIDVSDKDFMKNRNDYLWVLDEIVKRKN